MTFSQFHPDQEKGPKILTNVPLNEEKTVAEKHGYINLNYKFKVYWCVVNKYKIMIWSGMLQTASET